MNRTKNVIFVCEHGAAKSIIAAAYFNKLAEERNLNLLAIARGIHPDQELSPKTVAGLHVDGLTSTESKPQQLTLADLESAQHIITFCELPVEFQNRIIAERWDGIPPVSENYEHARNAILQHVERLFP